MNGLVCPKCEHVRRRQYDRHGNKHGWFCAECQRIKRRDAKLGIVVQKRDTSTCPKCGYKRIQRYVNNKKRGWRCQLCDRKYRRLISTMCRNREHSRNNYSRNVGKRKEARRHWQNKNHTKTAAHSLVRRAVNDGRLVKQPCNVCGNTNVEAHHDDYSQPLSVRWLCKKHHEQQHETRFQD